MQAVSSTQPRFLDQYENLKENILATPAEATVKGMYIDAFLQSVTRRGMERPTTRRFLSFKDYPLREFQELLLQATVALHPNVPPREGLKLLGRMAYPTLAESTVGKILFSIAGRDWHAALPLSRRAYEISLNPGRAELKEVTQTSATMCLRDVWNFADTYQVGVYEGAMECYLVSGTVRARRGDRLCDVDLLMDWS